MNSRRHLLGLRMRILIDANVLVYLSLSDLLLRLALFERLFIPFWSREILTEVERTLVRKLGWLPEEVNDRFIAMNTDFPNALVTGFDSWIPSCTNDAKDRHVLAAAIHSQASTILTFNTKHFGPEHLAAWGICAQRPSDYLISLYSQHPKPVWRQLRFAAHKKKMTLRALLEGYSSQLDSFTSLLLSKLP